MKSPLAQALQRQVDKPGLGNSNGVATWTYVEHFNEVKPIFKWRSSYSEPSWRTLIAKVKKHYRRKW